MDSAFLLAITLIGLLLIVQVLSLGTAMKSVLWVVLAFVFGPFLFQALKAETGHFLTAQLPWWAYILAFVGGLLLLRLLFTFLFPGRRR